MKRINRPITLTICKEHIINVIVEIKKQTKTIKNPKSKQESSFRNIQKGEMRAGSHLTQLLAV